MLTADITVRQLERKSPASAHRIPLVTTEDVAGKSFTKFGHPTGFTGRGKWAEGEMCSWEEDGRL